MPTALMDLGKAYVPLQTAPNRIIDKLIIGHHNINVSVMYRLTICTYTYMYEWAIF